MENEKKFVILVDDNPATLQSGMNVLSSRYRVATAPSAVKLFELLESSIPDIILLDIDIPEVDGYQIIKVLKFRQNTKEIPVIFLTGKSSSEDEIKGLSLGAVDYITKPFNPALLLKRVEMHMLVLEQRKTMEAQSVELQQYNENLQKLVMIKLKNISEMQESLVQTMTLLTECRDDAAGMHIDSIREKIRELLEELKKNMIDCD